MSKNIYDGILRFNGTFRPYQQRVLDRAGEYLKDGRVHIVAAPGSGKTTLGIELIRRLGEPALVLSPRLVIRDQWLDRIREAFLQPDCEAALSADLRKPGLITSVTYQALFSAVTRFKGKLSAEDEGEEENEDPDETVDFSGFDLVAAMRRAGVRVLCLDECHHLRSEWWQALESFTSAMADAGLAVIALTATPPWDAAPAERERYTALCGPVDEEITVPELVAADCLCPHQDYVYFSTPTEAERQELNRMDAAAAELLTSLRTDDALAAAVSAHRGLRDYNGSRDAMLEDPSYLSSLLIYLNGAGRSFDRRWLTLLGTEDLPPLTEEWLQILLQGFLYDDMESYPPEAAGFRESLEARLKRAGLIQRRRVVLTDSEGIRKLMASSLSKLESAAAVARAEYGSMGGDLRMLVLSDYIRKEFFSDLGGDAPLTSLGVIPLFETLRRALPGECRLAVLSGGAVILPEEALPALQEAAGEAVGVSASPLSAPDGTALGYARVSCQGKASALVGPMTVLFQAGRFQILVGTKSLLGEGYDAPCVNSLILASFVGSYVLCNQMRGRAIRVQKGAPDKTANIWHLVCVDEPAGDGLRTGNARSGDLETLARRMEAFQGLSYDGGTIENGIARLGISEGALTDSGIKTVNAETLARAARRDGLRDQWQTAVVKNAVYETTDEYAVPGEVIRTRSRASLLDILGPLALFLVGDLLIIFYRRRFAAAALLGKGFSLPGLILAAGLTFLTLLYAYRFLRRLSPVRYLKGVAEGTLRALREKGGIRSDCQVAAESGGNEETVYLKGGEPRERELFAQCVEEFFAPLENQRYILRLKRGGKGLFRYYCVPAVFSKRREDGELFLRHVEGTIGKAELIYTRSPEGRAELLKARAMSWANLSAGVSDVLAGRRRKRADPALH